MPEGVGERWIMERSRIYSSWPFVGVLAAAVLVVGCGGAGSAGSAAESSEGPAKPASQGPCGGDRPILFLEGVGCADGTTIADSTSSGAGDSWSPSGDEEAFVSNNAKRLVVRGVDGSERTVYRAPKHILLVHRPAWSADGGRLAVLLLDDRGFQGGVMIDPGSIPSYRSSLVVFDAASGALRSRVRLSPAIVHMPFLMNPPDTLAFSPDGGRVLVSWESPAVVDLKSGHVRRIWTTPSVASWTADGRVLFLDVVNRHRFGALRVWSSDGSEHVIWRAAQLRANGIVAEHGIEYGALRTSPDGSRLAVRTSQPNGTALLVYSLAGSTPGQRIGSYPTSGRIWDFDWSPDGHRLAAVVLDGTTVDVRVLDPNHGTWTSIATIPITIDSTDTLEAIAPIKKLSWNG